MWFVNSPPPWAIARTIPFARFFQIHERFSLSDAEEAWVTQCPAPLYVSVLADYRDAQDPRAYPLQDVLRLPVPAPWLASSFSWALALACWEGRHGGAESGPPVTHLTLYGVELQMGSTRERLVEHAGVLFWVGYAAGLGIVVDVPPESGVLDYPYPYGLAYYAEGDEARQRVLAFERMARAERRARAWTTYDAGMRRRRRQQERRRR